MKNEKEHASLTSWHYISYFPTNLGWSKKQPNLHNKEQQRCLFMTSAAFSQVY